MFTWLTRFSGPKYDKCRIYSNGRRGVYVKQLRSNFGVNTGVALIRQRRLFKNCIIRQDFLILHTWTNLIIWLFIVVFSVLVCLYIKFLYLYWEDNWWIILEFLIFQKFLLQSITAPHCRCGVYSGRRLLVFLVPFTAFIWGRRLFEGGVNSSKYGGEFLLVQTLW